MDPNALATPAFPPHVDGWTVAELLALPEDQGNRVELVDGTVVVTPAPTSAHQRMMQRVQVALAPLAPAGCELLPGVNVLLGAERLLIPDLTVVTAPGLDVICCQGNDVLLAVEIHSPSTRAYDRALKRQLYQDACAPFLLFVDPATAPASATLYRLDGGEYREAAESAGGRLVLAEPFAVDLDLSGSGR